MPDLTLTSAVDTFLGSADQAAMRTNLGLGTMATQAASAVAITGGTFGFWGAGPVAQFNTSAGAGISAWGSGNPVFDDSTFVGSTGSTAYTVNDLISALKLCGVLAA